MALTATQSTNLATNLLNTVAPFEMADGQIKKSIAVLKRWIARNVSGQGKLLFETTDDDLAQVVKNSLFAAEDKAKVVSAGVVQTLKTGGIGEWSKKLVIPFVGGETRLQGGVSAPARAASQIGPEDPDLPNILETATDEDKPTPTDPTDADKGRDKSGRKAGSRATPKNPLTASEQHMARRLGVAVKANTTFDDILNAAYQRAESIADPAKRQLAIKELGEVAALKDTGGAALGRLDTIVEGWENDNLIKGAKTTKATARDARRAQKELRPERVAKAKGVQRSLYQTLKEGGEIPPKMQRRLEKLSSGGKGGRMFGQSLSAKTLKDILGTQAGTKAAAAVPEGKGIIGGLLSSYKKDFLKAGKGSMKKGLLKGVGGQVIPLALLSLLFSKMGGKDDERRERIEEIAPERTTLQMVQDANNQEFQMKRALGASGPDPRILEMIQNYGREGLSRSQTRIGPNPLMAGLQSGKLSMQDIMALLQQQGA